MIRRATLSLLAISDLEAAADWIAQDSPRAARRLRSAVQAAALRIAEYPRLGAPRPDLLPPGQRLFVLPGWPYLLIHEEGPGQPRILRLLHGARDLPAAVGIP